MEKRYSSGLSMPHSPRRHAGRLWLLQPGTGELGHVDLNTGAFERVCLLPGVRHPHLIGLSKDDIRFIITPDPGRAFDRPSAPHDRKAPS